MRVEARSPQAEEQAHTAEFASGVLFGVAAALAVAAVQEALPAVFPRRRRRQPAGAAAAP